VDTGIQGLLTEVRYSSIDGHVETYEPDETAILEVAETLDGTKPALSGFGLGAGQFYLPREAVLSRP